MPPSPASRTIGRGTPSTMLVLMCTARNVGSIDAHMVWTSDPRSSDMSALVTARPAIARSTIMSVSIRSRSLPVSHGVRCFASSFAM